MALVSALHKVGHYRINLLLPSHVKLLCCGRRVATRTSNFSTHIQQLRCKGISSIKEKKHFVPHCGFSSNYNKSEVVKDVFLFKNDSPFFFRLIGVFACAQLVFWGYLTHTAFTSMKDAHVLEVTKYGPDGAPPEARSWKTLSDIYFKLSSTKWRYGVTLLCLGAGGSILTAAVMFSRRSVSALILRKGGENVTFVLFGFLGIRTSFTVPISRVSCRHSRSAVTSQLPVKVKGHSFHYILDKQQGRFLNGRLFDYTVGMKRVFV